MKPPPYIPHFPDKPVPQTDDLQHVFKVCILSFTGSNLCLRYSLLYNTHLNMVEALSIM